MMSLDFCILEIASQHIETQHNAAMKRSRSRWTKLERHLFMAHSICLTILIIGASKMYYLTVEQSLFPVFLFSETEEIGSLKTETLFTLLSEEEKNA